MPRKPREEVEGGVYHVYARGNDKRLIYRDDADRRMYLRMFRATVRQYRWRLLAYCLMDNHVHLLLETPEANLGRGIQRMHGLYAREFNTRHRRSGHLFQGRYGAVRIKTDEQLWTVAVYVAMNPVKAGFCARPDEWPWSSHAAALTGIAPDWFDVSRLMSYFGSAGDDPRRRYAEMCEMGSDPLRVVEGWSLGWDHRDGEVDGWTGCPEHPEGQLGVAAARIEAERGDGRVRD